MIQNDLLDIISSLSKSERRLFKLSIKTYGNKETNLIEKLFEIYCKNDQLKTILKKAKHKIPSARLSKMHSELFKKLQKFIGEIEMKNERKYRLYNNIFIARSLLKRSLYNQANNIIEKTIFEANKFEIFPVLVEAYGYKQFLKKHIGSIKKTKTFKDSFFDDYSEVIEKNSIFYKRFNTYAKLLEQYSSYGSSRDNNQVNQYRKLLTEIDTNIDYGFNINKMNLLCKSIIGQLIQDNQIVISSKKGLYENYLNHKEFIDYNINEYFLTCYNYAGNLIETKHFSGTLPVLNQLDKLIDEYPILEEKEVFVNGLYLSFYLKSEAPISALQYAQKFNTFLSNTDDLIYLNFIAVNVVIANLINKEYELALEAINIVLNRNVKKLRKDCYALLLTYEIIIYYKLEWLDLVESKIRSLNRYLKVHYNKTAFEKWVIKFLNRAQKINFKQACEEAYYSIDNLKADSLSQDIMNFSQFELWFKIELKF